MVSWNSFDRSGHWASHDAPDVLSGDLRQFFAGLRIWPRVAKLDPENKDLSHPPVPSARFYLIDVFAQRPLTGNPLALVPDAYDLAEAQMRAIAREFNQSETTFLLHPGVPGATWRLRSFTPIGAEVYGAGHNALGAWLWLAGSGRLAAGRDGFAQQIGEEVLPVRVDRAGKRPGVSMDQSAPVFGATVEDRAELAGSLGLTEDDLAPGVPEQVAGTGASHLMVPVRTRATVDRARPGAARLAAVVAHAGGEGAYFYSLEPGDDDAVAY